MTHRRDRGATIPIVALALPVLILMTAFAIDLGRQRSSRRTMQARADVIALDLVRLADGRPEAEVIAGDADHLSAEQALVQSAARNGIARAQITEVDWGTFVGGAFNTTALPVPTAVRVTAEETTDYFFQPGSGDVARSAVATNSPTVDVTVGAIGAGFQPGYPGASAQIAIQVQALNSRLAGQFNASTPTPSTGFDLVGYQGLAAADVDLWRVAANGGFGSPNELMDSDITAGQFFSWSAQALDQQAAEGDPNAANAATQLRRFESQMGVDSTSTMQMGDTFEFAQGGDDAAASGSVNVVDLLSGGAHAINGSSCSPAVPAGEPCTFLSYNLTPTIPGISSITVSQQTIRPPTYAFNQRVGDLVSNAQVRFQVDLTVAPLAGMTQAVTIPIVVEAATADGTVDRLSCNTPATASEADIEVDTSAVRVTLGTAVDLSAANLVINDARLVQAGGVTISTLLNLGLALGAITGLDLTGALTASASGTLLGANDQLLFFDPNDPPVDYQRAPGGLGGTSLAAQMQSSFVARLSNTLLGATASANLFNQLGYVFNNLTPSILDPLLQSAGVTIAGADVKAEDLECNGPMLVG
ncbi:MAG: pilus assembly protein TadG-related protein [Acidimicrobiales bacterium]